MRRALRAVAAAGLATGGWLLVAGPAAAVDAPTIDDTGWWTRTSQQALPTAGVLQPDVTAGQLLVEGTPEGATAIAALRATLPEGGGDPVLTLQAPSSMGGETAVLLACQAGSGWTGAHAGSWEAKPSPDCDASVQGVPSEDGTEWTFALGALRFGDQIDVVLTPGVVAESEGAFSSTFRIVFERPGPDAITVSSGPAPPPAIPDPSTGPGVAGAGPGAGGSPVASGGAPSFSVPPPPTPARLDQQPARAALPADEQGATATAPSLGANQPLAAPPVEVSDRDGQALGVLVVLAAGALLWWSSQQPVPERRVLSRFATAAARPAPIATAEATVGGLGRFRRERTAPARPLA